MNALKRGCLEVLVVWAIAGAALYFNFHSRFEPPGDIWGAVIGGLFLSFAWGSARNIVASYQRKKLLEHAKTGVRPKDGELFAVAGTVHPTGAPLLTPFKKAECISYGYEVFIERTVRSGSGKDSTTRNEKQTFMGGFAMCPSVIRTPTGEVKILGFPFPNEFPEHRFSLSDIRDTVNAYIASTTFAENKGLGVGSMWTALNEVLSEDDGSHRHDWKSDRAELAVDEDGTMVMEQYIPANAEICAIGKYSAIQNGLLNDLSSGGLEVFSGNLDKAIRALRGRVRQYIFLAILFGAMGSAGATGVLTVREKRDPNLKQQREERLISAIKSDDIALAERQFEKGLTFNDVSSNIDQTLLEIRSDAMLELLLRNDFDINKVLSSGYTLLLWAVQRNDEPLVRRLLAAGANPNIPQQGWKITAVERAFDDRERELFQLLREKDGEGIFVTERNGTEIPPAKREEFFSVIKRYFTAHNNDDTDGVRAVTDDWPADFFESFARGLYRGTRVCEPQFGRGFSNAGAASVIVLCPSGGAPVSYLFTLVRRGGGWKIRREAWDEEGRWQQVLRTPSFW